MTRRILTLRISRRAIGAAVLAGDALTFLDGRHLTSDRERAYVTAARYVERLLDLSKADGVVLDAPQPAKARGDRLVEAVTTALRDRHLTPLVIGRSDLLPAYGIRALRNRASLRDIVTDFWPELGRCPGKVQPYVADAAAAALYAESRLALHPSPT